MSRPLCQCCEAVLLPDEDALCSDCVREMLYDSREEAWTDAERNPGLGGWL